MFWTSVPSTYSERTDLKRLGKPHESVDESVHDDKSRAQTFLHGQSAAHGSNDNPLRLIMLQIFPPRVTGERHEINVYVRIVNAPPNHTGQPEGVG
ncbi:hypothetical protein Fuma_06007 [Fuerstiella marisgermanici]|uniref:Uncharacterized protein n=1 Tax=Fuerstiella marisgermanici TaxID=1891926 RepID=A0A1P8WQL7_9PLAN|nr:hypothetical protein Fuma_06007 [Fuerstiella marisgermanici]